MDELVTADHDVFISHASEDKDDVARPLAKALKAIGAKIWFDEVKIEWGASISASIDRGLAQSKYGLVVLSPCYFAKEWPQRELQGLVQKQIAEKRVVILPVYYNVSHEDVRLKSPTLADVFALKWEIGAEAIAENLRRMLGGQAAKGPVAQSQPGEDTAVVEKAKTLMQGGQTIAVQDLLQKETDAAVSALGDKQFDPNFRPEGNQGLFDEFKRRLGAYDETIKRLSALLATIAYYGGSEHHVAIRRSLERIGDEPNDLGKNGSGGLVIWSDLRRYPSILAFHRTACAAISADKWQNLKPILNDATIAERALSHTRVPMLTRMRPFDIVETGYEQWLASNVPTIQQKRYTPAEDYFAERVAEALAWFGVDLHEAERVFDAWLMLAQITHLGIPEGKGRWDTCFSVGRWWRINSAFRGWDHSPQAELINRVRNNGESSQAILAVSSTDRTTFLERAEVAQSMIQNIRS